MYTLILSCNTGEGHNACARAIKEYYDIVGQKSVVEDSLAFVSEEVSSLVAKGHILIYRKLSPVFGWGYEFAQNHPKKFDGDSKIYQFLARGSEKLHESIVEHGYDNVICTHPFSAMMLTEVVKRYDMKIHTAFVATDYTCCPGVNGSDLDLYFVPDPLLVDEFVSQGIPAEKIYPSGIPVRQEFYNHVDQAKAKESFGVAAGHKHIVVACGSMGCGPMGKLSQSLSESMGSDTELTIVCGTNEALKRSMDSIHGNEPNIHVQGFVQDMPLLLDSADVYVTKPGGLSTTEAASKRCPMVLVNAVGGCEDYNLNHFLKTGKALTGESINELVDACLQQLKGNENKQPGQTALNAAKFIYETMQERQNT